jgi:hypothetical protein
MTASIFFIGAPGAEVSPPAFPLAELAWRVPASETAIHKENQCVTGQKRDGADSAAQSFSFLPKMQAVHLR